MKHCLKVLLFVGSFCLNLFLTQGLENQNDPNTLVIGVINSDSKTYRLQLENGKKDELLYNSTLVDLLVKYNLKKISHLINYDNENKTVSAVFGHRKIIIKNIRLPNDCDAPSLLTSFLNNVNNVDAYIHGDAFEVCNQRTGKGGLRLTCDMMYMLCNKWKKPCVSWSSSSQLVKPKETIKDEEEAHYFSVIPHAESIADGTLSILKHYQWKNIGFFYTFSPNPYRTICGKLQQALLTARNVSVQYSRSFTREYLRGNGSADPILGKTLISTINGYVRRKTIKVNFESVHRSNFTFGQWRENQSQFSVFDQILLSLYETNKELTEKQAFIMVDPIGRFYSQNQKNVRKKRAETRHFEAIDKKLKRNSKNIFYKDNFEKRSVDENNEENIDHQISAPGSLSNITVTAAYPVYNFNPYSNVIIMAPAVDQSFGMFVRKYVHSNKYRISNQIKKDSASSLLAYFTDAVALLTESWISWTHTTPAHERFITNLSKEIHAAYIRSGATGTISFDRSSGLRKINFLLWDVVVGPVKGTYNQTSRRQAVPIFKLMYVKGEEFLTFSMVNEDGTSGMSWSSKGVPAPDKNCDPNDLLCFATTTNLRVLDFIIALTCCVGMVLGGYTYVKYKKKRKEIRETTRGPNKLFLNSTDLIFSGRGVSNPQAECQTARNGSNITLQEAILSASNNNGSGTIASLQVKDLRHENLCRFYGLCTEPAEQGLVMEYCSRRSLKDVINSDLDLDLTFKMSLILDLVKGMKYIHSSSIKYHGRLKSTNCLINSRFMLKVTDYGVNKIQTISGMKMVEEPNQSLLWTAPEHLTKTEQGPNGSQKGDSFSFAIILQEILLQQGPYEGTGCSPDEIVHKLKSAPPLFRPSVAMDSGPLEVIHVMKQCWQEQADLRMSFGAIHTELRRISRGKKNNILENMMKKLEAHNSDLENAIVSRTKQLSDEKKKTENLLLRMLPRSAAEMLMANKTVVPETFDKCSIYFSDICGFTTISHASTPMQVVDLLNDLYSCFDEVISHYDVYKVETIGDAYMVSAGVPKRIGDKHASEIALMALDILSATCTFKIRHLPGVVLRIRIGLHSGSCVGGVVGLTMPRYCLFGDMINTAARLESTGIPSRIHISQITRDLLVESGMGFAIEKRGNIELKGRGDMTTWWLTGKEGWKKDLPEPGDVEAPNHGIDLGDYIPRMPNNRIKNKQDSGVVMDVKAINQNEDTPYKKITSTPGLQAKNHLIRPSPTISSNSNLNNNHFIYCYSEKSLRKFLFGEKLKKFKSKKKNEVRPLV